MRRGVETYTTVRAAAAAGALCLGLLALAAFLSASPALRLLLITLLIGPALLMIAGFCAGWLPMGFCLAAVLAALFVSGGAAMAGIGVVYLLPVTLLYLLCLRRRIPFWKSCGILAVTLLLSQFALFALLYALAGGSPFLKAGSLAAQAIYDSPYRDSLLYSLISMGMLTVPAGLREGAVIALDGSYALSEQVVSELLLQVRSLISQLGQSVMPSLLISGSGLNALLGLSLGIRWGRLAAQRRAFRAEEETQEIPDLAMPPLRAWHLPRPWGLRIGVLGLGYLLAQTDSGALSMLGALMFQVFSLCFGVQGLAAMNDSQHKRGSARGWRTLVVVLALIFRFMQIALIILGVIDQITNARGLRPPMRPRNEEEE